VEFGREFWNLNKTEEKGESDVTGKEPCVERLL
jgi:hypothetical protein